MNGTNFSCSLNISPKVENFVWRFWLDFFCPNDLKSKFKESGNVSSDFDRLKKLQIINQITVEPHRSIWCLLNLGDSCLFLRDSMLVIIGINKWQSL